MLINYYMVGGYVRDKLMGKESKDIDFSVEAPSYDAMRQDLLVKGIDIKVEKPEFLTIRGRFRVPSALVLPCRNDNTQELNSCQGLIAYQVKCEFSLDGHPISFANGCQQQKALAFWARAA